MSTDPTDPTPAAAETTPADATPTIADEERKARLHQRVQIMVGQGYRVESQTDTQVTMVKGHRHNHLLHLILTLLTLGLWGLFVWLPLAIFGGEKRRAVMINQAGQPYETKA